ncbi:hypothetical protein HK100_004462 [Physocladia obscura]|uniref:Uncharacterized protein n=1 Tax=Physocladia obscura TaxID=109957 RepID=A0AAD5T9U8_9FUNG|nr:hypothetical protein HK100_004462 [Physocladia obscura]
MVQWECVSGIGIKASQVSLNTTIHSVAECNAYCSGPTVPLNVKYSSTVVLLPLQNSTATVTATATNSTAVSDPPVCFCVALTEAEVMQLPVSAACVFCSSPLKISSATTPANNVCGVAFNATNITTLALLPIDADLTSTSTLQTTTPPFAASTNADTNSNSANTSPNVGAIVGGVLAALIIIAIAITAFLCWRTRRRTNKHQLFPVVVAAPKLNTAFVASLDNSNPFPTIERNRTSWVAKKSGGVRLSSVGVRIPVKVSGPRKVFLTDHHNNNTTLDDATKRAAASASWEKDDGSSEDDEDNGGDEEDEEDAIDADSSANAHAQSSAANSNSIRSAFKLGNAFVKKWVRDVRPGSAAE